MSGLRNGESAPGLIAPYRLVEEADRLHLLTFTLRNLILILLLLCHLHQCPKAILQDDDSLSDDEQEGRSNPNPKVLERPSPP